MKKYKLNNLLYEFAKSSSTEVAYLLHGEWGSGKTHFITEIFLPSIQAKNIYYISLFGVSNIEQVYTQLLTQRYIGKKSGKVLRISAGIISTVIKGITNYLGEKVKLKSSDIGVGVADLIPIDDCVIIFDDLERVSEKADFSELIGQISTYFISESSIRVIFVADEDKINNKDIYNAYKEKLIGFQSAIEIDLKDTLISIANKKKNNNFKIFLVSNINFIYEMIMTFEIRNLRTIGYYFDILEIVHADKLRSMISKEDFLYSVFVLAIEEKENRFASIRKIDDVPQHVARKKDDKWSMGTNNEMGKHFDKYIISSMIRNRNYELNYYFYASVFDIIRFGKLDRDKLNNEIEEFDNFKSQNLESKLMNLVNKLRGYYFMTNQEFVTIYREFLEELENTSSNLSFAEVVNISRILYYLQNKSQLNVNAMSLIEKYLRQRINEIIKSKSACFSPNVQSILDREIGEIQRSDPELAQELDTIMKDLSSEYLRQEINNIIEKADFSKLSEYDFRKFLFLEKPDNVISIIKGNIKNVGKLEEFTKKMERSFKIPISSFDKIMKDNEKERLIVLKDKLVSYQKKLVLIENIWIEEMIRTLNEAIG